MQNTQKLQTLIVVCKEREISSGIFTKNKCKMMIESDKIVLCQPDEILITYQKYGFFIGKILCSSRKELCLS